MNILLALVPVSLLLLGAAIWAFLWAVRRGQFDDLDTPPLDILGNDDAPAPPQTPRGEPDAFLADAGRAFDAAAAAADRGDDPGNEDLDLDVDDDEAGSPP